MMDGGYLCGICLNRLEVYEERTGCTRMYFESSKTCDSEGIAPCGGWDRPSSVSTPLGVAGDVEESRKQYRLVESSCEAT